MRIIGIDPGTRIVGYGIVDADGHEARMVECGAATANLNDPEPKRLLAIYEVREAGIARCRPDVACVEDIFAGKNAKTALTIGEGRGVALLALARAGIDVHSVPPATIKKAITGNGNAKKAQVQGMVARLLGLAEPPESYDAADALAAALYLGHRLG